MDRTPSRMQSYRRLSEAVSRARESAEVCEAALGYVRERLAVERSAILTLDEKRHMRFRAHRGLSDRYRAVVEKLSPWGPDDPDPQPRLVLDPATDPVVAPHEPLLREEGIAQLAFLPLRARGLLIGRLTLYGDAPADWDEEWLHEAVVVGDVIAGALDAHQAQALLRGANGLLTALMESMPDAVGFVDGRGRLVYTTRRIESFFPLTVDAMIGLDAQGFVAAVSGHVQDPEVALGRIRKALVAPGPVTVEVRHVDGRVFELACVPTAAPQALEGRLVQLRDVTQRRELEARLLHAHKMESVGRLAGGVAHDFNNLLTAMIGYVDLAAASLPEGGEEHGYLVQALEAAEQASGLTRQLLAFARRQPVRPSALDANALLERMEPLLRRLVPGDIEIVTRTGARPAWVLADAGQLEQVLVNLAFHARDAMPGGGRLTVATSREPSATLAGGEAVVLEVADTGAGLDAETQAHLFEPFYPTRPGGIGAGLGLATVYGIVQQFGGAMEVVSAPGEGARIRVLLPPTPAPAGAAAPNGAPPGHETVLLVEDDPSVRGLVVAMLGRLGYVVLAAERAEDALALLSEHRGDVDLLIADIVMPGMSGRELATRAQAARPHLRVLLTSGHAATGAGPHLAAGFAFMPKPFSIETLALRVRAALAGPVDQAGLPQ